MLGRLLWSASSHVASVRVQILRVLGESAIAVRTKAMKCLSEVVAVDPSILARVSSTFCSNEQEEAKIHSLARLGFVFCFSFVQSTLQPPWKENSDSQYHVISPSFSHYNMKPLCF